MIGLFFIFIITVYITVAVLTVKRLRGKTAKYVALAIYVLIPTWDILPGYFYFRHACAVEGGNTADKAVNVDGFYSYAMPFANKDAFTIYGYKFIEEGNPAIGNLRRYSLSPTGQIVNQEISEITSRYGLRQRELGRAWGVMQIMHEIYDIKSEQVIARGTYFIYLGSWIMTASGKLLGQRSGIFSECPENYWSEFRAFLVSVLKPIK